jgi:hypothetical protein
MFILLIFGYGWPTDGQTGQTKWAAQRHATPEKLRIITTKSWIANSFDTGIPLRHPQTLSAHPAFALSCEPHRATSGEKAFAPFLRECPLDSRAPPRSRGKKHVPFYL